MKAHSLREACAPMLAQQYLPCMATVYEDACCQACRRPPTVTGETLRCLIRRRRVFSCGAKIAACTTSHKRTGTGGVLSCGEGTQQAKVLLRTGTIGVQSCGEGRRQFNVLLGLANCAGASLMHCTKLGWIGVYTFAKFASALVNFSYKFVDGNTTFNDRPLTDLKIKCVQS